MKRFGFLLLMMNLLVFAGYASAAVVGGLYQASVPVADHSAQARQTAIERALLDVLGKVSGNTVLETVPEVKTQLANAASLVQQYRYIPSVSTPLGATGPQLQVFFDKKAVNQLLLKTGQAIWPGNRPRIAVWIALIDDGERDILTRDDGQTTDSMTDLLAWLVQHNAEHYGIPIQLPSASLVKGQAVSIADIATFQSVAVLPFQTILQSDGLLMGRIMRTPDHQWQATWDFALGNEHYQWQRIDDDVNSLFEHLFRNLTDSLAEQFAILAGDDQANSVLITIDQVNNANGYANVIRYLSQLPLVASVNVVTVADNQITVDVNAKGGEQALRQALNFGHTLVQEHNMNYDQSQMRYQLSL